MSGTPSTPSGRRDATESSASWRLSDRIGLGLAWTLGVLFCVICAAVVVYFAVEGIRFLQPQMLWTNPRVSATGQEAGGFLAPILGTLMVTAIAMAIALPVGVWVAVWLSEYARPRWLARIVESTIEMFAAIPSVVLALFGLVLFAAPILGFLSEVNNGHVYGKSFFAAGGMLSLLALPIVVTTVREGLQAIPNHVREASYAVGKSKITTIRRVLLPALRPNTITGAMVGAGHVIGDTAIIVLLLGGTYTLEAAGNVPVLKYFQGTGSTLTSYIFDNAPTGDLNQPHKAYAAAVVLLLMVLFLNLIVDVFGRRSRELKWS